MNLINFGDYIGIYAPLILFILTIFLLRNMKVFLQIYVVGNILNNILNILLKIFIKEPRPSDDRKSKEIGVKNGDRVGFDKYGMPSGHAQNCGYNLAFIFFALNNPYITLLYALISIISLLQRFIFKNHNILQLFVGLNIGLVVGYIFYEIGNKYLIGNSKMKKDDDGPL